MAIRLKPMKRILKDTGSIYLHCDPTASHYLKLLIDAIFNPSNFRNEIVWHYGAWTNAAQFFQRNHDLILYYSKTEDYTFNRIMVPRQNPAPYNIQGGKVNQLLIYRKDETPDHVINDAKKKGRKIIEIGEEGMNEHDVWTYLRCRKLDKLPPRSKERTGYPTQKPLALLERIIEASSDRGHMVLDPFCGCGTTLHAAEKLGRKWIGCDISNFSAGLVRNRLMDKMNISRNQFTMIGPPNTVEDAKDLARRSPFEFEKWVCGEIGARGMYHNPGSPGADAGVDGIIPFYHAEEMGKKAETAYAIVQVKGGRVTADSVRALSTVVDQHEQNGVRAKCGIFVCFDKFMNTVNNNRTKRTIKDLVKDFDFIQPLSVEELIRGKRPNLPWVQNVPSHH